MTTKNVGPFIHRQPITPPDGTYRGVWGGYVVIMQVNGQDIEFQTDTGVRGMGIPVVVTVTGGVAEVREVTP